MRIILGPSKTCLVVPENFVLACNTKEPVDSILKSFAISFVFTTVKAWNMFTTQSWFNQVNFAWWEAALVAHKCNNATLINALQSYIVDKHINSEYNIRIVWTRMQYLSVGQSQFARHQPSNFINVDDLTPIINTPELAQFGKVIAERFRTRLQSKCVHSTEISTRAARVNVKAPGLSCVTLQAGEKAYLCVSPPHDRCDAAMDLLKSNVDVTAGPPEWFVARLRGALKTLDQLEKELDHAIGIQQQLQESAENIAGALHQFNASSSTVKDNVINMMTENIASQIERVTDLQDKVNTQERRTSQMQDTMDWFVRETNEIKTFIEWKQACIQIEDEVNDPDEHCAQSD